MKGKFKMIFSIRWRKNAWKRSLKLVAIISSVVGSIFQAYDATSEYMAYPTLTRLTKEPLLNQSIPAIGLCASYEQKVYQKKTILHRLLRTKNISQILNHCTVLNGNTYDYIDCMSVSKVNEYIDSQLKCYSFFESRSMVQNATLDFDWISRGLPIFDINISVPVLYDLQPLLLIYPPHEFLSQKRSYHNKVWMPQDGRTEFVFTFSILRYKLLPAPYGNPCTDYASLELRSRANALDKCLSHNFVINGSRYQPYQTFANRESSIEELSIKSINIDKERSLVQSAMEICIEKVSGDDCLNDNYNIIEISSKPGPKNQSSIRATLTALPSYVRENKLEPVTSMVEYINWIGSIFNLWLGFAAFMSSSACISFIFQSSSPPKTQPKSLIKKEKKSQNSAAPAKLLLLNQYTVMLIAMIFAAVQTSDIVKIYFEAPFKWNFFANPQEYVALPVAVFCVDRTIDHKRLQTSLPDVYNSTPAAEWDKNLTLDQQYDMTFNATEVFDFKRSKFTSRSKMSWDRLVLHFSSRKYINHKHLCFRTFSHDLLVDKKIKLQDYKQSLIELMQYFSVVMRINRKRTKQILMVIQMDTHFTLEGNERIATGSLQNLVFPVSKDIRFQMNKYITYFRQTERSFWPNHLASQCFPYQENLGKERSKLLDACIKNCIMKGLSHNSTNHWPRELFYSNSMSNMNMSKLLQNPLIFSSSDSDLQAYEEKCRQKYPLQDCYSSFIEMFTEDIFRTHKTPVDIMSLTLYPPGKGYLKMKQNLRYSFTGLLGFIGGTIGFWLGIAVIDFDGVIIRMTKFASRNLLFRREKKEKQLPLRRNRVRAWNRKNLLVLKEGREATKNGSSNYEK